MKMWQNNYAQIAHDISTQWQALYDKVLFESRKEKNIIQTQTDDITQETTRFITEELHKKLCLQIQKDLNWTDCNAFEDDAKSCVTLTTITQKQDAISTLLASLQEEMITNINKIETKYLQEMKRDLDLFKELVTIIYGPSLRISLGETTHIK